MTVFTLVFTLFRPDEQIVWADKSSQTDKSSDMKTGRTNFQMTSSSEFVRLFVLLVETIFLRQFIHPDEQVEQSPT